jgi:hypothetical protein
MKISEFIKNSIFNFNVLRYLSYTVVIFLSVYLRVSTPLVTIFDYDSEGYVFPALKLFLEGDFTHVYSRPYVYQLFLFFLLKVGFTLNYVFVIQHVLSIISLMAMIIFIELFFKKKYAISTNHNIKYFVFVMLNFFMLFYFFCNGNTIAFEKMIRPEGVLIPSFIFLFVLLALLFEKKTTILFLTTIFWLSISALLHPRFSIGFYITVLLLIVYFVKLNHNDFKKLISFLSMAFILMAIVIVPEKYLVSKYDKSARIFGLKQFYYSHLSTIQKAILNGDFVFEDYDDNALKTKLVNANLNDNKYILSYNLDYFQYELGDNDLVQLLGESILKKYSISYTIDECLKKTDNLECNSALDEIRNSYHEYYTNWFKLLILKYPVDVAKKTFVQLKNFFLSIQYTYFIVDPGYIVFEKINNDFDLTYQYLQSIDFYKKNVFKEFAFNQFYLTVFQISDIVLRLFFLISVIFSFFANRYRYNLLLMSMLVISLSSIFLVSFTHTFDLYRYAYSIAPVNILIVYLLFVQLLSVVKRNN